MMKIITFLYRITLMPYVERDRYFEELVDDVYRHDIPRLTKKPKGIKPTGT